MFKNIRFPWCKSICGCLFSCWAGHRPSQWCISRDLYSDSYIIRVYSSAPQNSPVFSCATTTSPPRPSNAANQPNLSLPFDDCKFQGQTESLFFSSHSQPLRLRLQLHGLPKSFVFLARLTAQTTTTAVKPSMTSQTLASANLSCTNSISVQYSVQIEDKTINPLKIHGKL